MEWLAPKPLEVGDPEARVPTGPSRRGPGPCA